MHESVRTPPSYRNWKVKPYTVPPRMRLATERAQQVQPPLISLHARVGDPSAESAANQDVQP